MKHTLLMLVALTLLTATGCKRENRALSDSDIPLTVFLHRSWAHRHAPVDYECFELDFEVQINDADEILFIPLAFFAHLGIEGIVNGAVYSVHMLNKTKFVVYPDGQRAYRQRLYWGKNTVYFPANQSDEPSTLKIVVSGDRKVTRVIPIDLKKIKVLVLE